MRLPQDTTEYVEMKILKLLKSFIKDIQQRHVRILLAT